MQMTVKTASGSTYKFFQENGRIFFRSEKFSGELICINNGAISVDKSIDMYFWMDGVKGRPEENMMTMITTHVTDIQVEL